MRRERGRDMVTLIYTLPRGVVYEWHCNKCNKQVAAGQPAWGIVPSYERSHLTTEWLCEDCAAKEHLTW